VTRRPPRPATTTATIIAAAAAVAQAVYILLIPISNIPYTICTQILAHGGSLALRYDWLVMALLPLITGVMTCFPHLSDV
jgi:hypothetical protein